jgi:Peptidase inhibitor family I36
MSMVKCVTLFFVAGLLAATTFVAVPVVHAAQHGREWGSEAVPQAGACFYSDTNFRGRHFCLGVREDMPEPPRGTNDRISSIRVLGNAEVLAFRDVRFKGPEARFFGDMRDLRREGWNDTISSIRVVGRSGDWDFNRAPAWGRSSLPREGACFYRDVGFHGDYFCAPRGASFVRLPSGFEDEISSIRLIRAGGVMIFRDREFDGRSTRLTSDVADLRRGPWNDRISSIRVY